MSAKRFRLLSSVYLAFVGIGGCVTSGPNAANFAVRHFETSDRAAFLDAAAFALEETGYKMSGREPTEGRLVSEPQFDVARDRPTGRAAPISSKSLTRRIAEVRVEQPAERISVYCRVLVQERTTRAHRMLAYDRSGSDSPASTPIERGAATTDRQNTVWETIRRDRSAERRILAIIAERTAGATKP